MHLHPLSSSSPPITSQRSRVKGPTFSMITGQLLRVTSLFTHQSVHSPSTAFRFSKFEYGYASRRKGLEKMIAVVMEPDCQDTKTWQGAVGGGLGGHLYINLTRDDDSSFESGMKNLVEEILKVTGTPTLSTPDVKLATLSLSAGPIEASEAASQALPPFPPLPCDGYLAQRLFHQINTSYPGVRLVHESPYIFLVPDFLSSTECDQLIALQAASEERGPSATCAEQSVIRTSTTVIPPLGTVHWLRDPIAKLANVATEQLDQTKLTHYAKGEFFRAHIDADAKALPALYQHPHRALGDLQRIPPPHRHLLGPKLIVGASSLHGASTQRRRASNSPRASRAPRGWGGCPTGSARFSSISTTFRRAARPLSLHCTTALPSARWPASSTG